MDMFPCDNIGGILSVNNPIWRPCGAKCIWPDRQSWKARTTLKNRLTRSCNNPSQTWCMQAGCALLYLAQYRTLRTTSYNATSHTFTLHFYFLCAHSKKLSCFLSLFPSTCCLLRALLGKNWDITNGDEDLTNCENDEYEVRALLRWRLFRIFRKTRFYFVANDIGVVPSEATRAQTATTAKKKIADLIYCLSKDVYGTLKSLCLPDSPADRTFK